jgi:hypoxanthine phosphoribosyltransferase
MDIYAYLTDNKLSILLTIFFGLLSAYYQMENKRLNKEKRRINWEDLMSLTRSLRQKIYRDYKPQIFFSPCRRGATIANLMFLPNENVPLYVGIREDTRVTHKLNLDKKDFEVVSTGKYDHYIPNSLFEKTDSKLLIIDDFAETGDSLSTIVKYLIGKGFDKDKIKTATVVCSQTAVNANKKPDFFSIEMPGDFYFPWGKAI